MPVSNIVFADLLNSDMKVEKGLYMGELWRRMRTKATFRSNVDESYFEKLLRYIPADIVAGYVALNGMISAEAQNSASLQWIVFGVLLLLTPLYTCYLKTTPPGVIPEKVFPCLTAAFAFSVWVFAIGGPFSAQCRSGTSRFTDL